MKRLNDENSRKLVKYILDNKEGISTKPSDIEEIDFVSTKNNDSAVEYGIKVFYRNIPCAETRSQVWEKITLQNIEEDCKKQNLVPTIAFAVRDEETEGIYIFIFTVEQMECLSREEDTKDIFRETEKGLEIKYGVGRQTRADMLERIKRYVDYTEVRNGRKNFFD